MPKIIRNLEKRILEVAMKIIKDDGINKLSIRHIAKISRIGSGTIYNYFKNKEEIILRTIEIYWKEKLKMMKNKKYNNISDFIDDLYEAIYNYQKMYKDMWRNNNLKKIPENRNLMIKEIENLIKEKTKFKNPGFIIQNLMATATWNFVNYEELKKILLKGMIEC